MRADGAHRVPYTSAVPDDDADRPTTRWSTTDAPRGDDYDRRWEALERAGIDPHGEVAFVQRFSPSTVLDAGCGTTARAKAPGQCYVLADLATLDLRGACGAHPVPPFDLAVLAGNVMIFVAPGTEGTVLARMAAHLVPGGHLVAGFQLQPGGLDLATYDTLAAAAGFTLVERWATWSADPFAPVGATYAVSVHRLTAG